MNQIPTTVAIALCLTLPFASSTRLHASSVADVQRAGRDAALDKAVATRRSDVKTAVNKAADERVAGATQKVLEDLSEPAAAPDAAASARSAVTTAFPHLTPDQTKLLTFYVLAEVARVTTDADTLNKRAAPADGKGIHDLSKEQVARLLRLMDEGSPFAATLRRELDSTASIPAAVLKDVR